MNAAEFEEVALALIGRGYSPIPIMPGSKSPGWRNYDGSWDRCPSGTGGVANSLRSTRLLHGSG